MKSWKSWNCRWCGAHNVDRGSFCGECQNGRTQKIEDQFTDLFGGPRRRLVKRGSTSMARYSSRQPTPTDLPFNSGYDQMRHSEARRGAQAMRERAARLARIAEVYPAATAEARKAGKS